MTQSDLCLYKTNLAAFWKRHGTEGQSRHSRSLEKSSRRGMVVAWMQCWQRKWEEVDINQIWRGQREVSRMASQFWLFKLDRLWYLPLIKPSCHFHQRDPGQKGHWIQGVAQKRTPCWRQKLGSHLISLQYFSK